MPRSRRVSRKAMEEQMDHDYDHKDDSSFYGDYFTSGVKAYFPKEGRHRFIIIPYQLEKNSVFRKTNPDLNKAFSKKDFKNGDNWAYHLDVFTHRNVGPGKDAIICPRTIKEPCPVCEERMMLEKEAEELKRKDRNTEDIKKEIAQLQSSKKALYNIVPFDSRKERKAGPVVWPAPFPSIQKVLVEKGKDSEGRGYKHFSVPEDNWLILYRREGSGLNTDYTNIAIKKLKRDDRLSEDELDRFYDNAFVLDDVVEILSYDKIKEMLHGYADDEEEEEEDRKSSRRDRDEDEDDYYDDDYEEDEDEEEEEERPKRKKKTRKRRDEEEEDDYDDDEEEDEGSDYDDDYDDEDEEEEKPRPRRKNKKKKSSKKKRKPECFGIDFGDRDECEDCDYYEECYEESESGSDEDEDEEEEERSKKKTKKKKGKSSRRRL